STKRQSDTSQSAKTTMPGTSRVIVANYTMKKTTNKTLSRRMTRREFVGRALAAGIISGAPAFLRGQNLNSKLNIAFIACGGRANASLGELTIVPGRSASGSGRRSGAASAGPHPDAHVTVLCDVNAAALDSASRR